LDAVRAAWIASRASLRADTGSEARVKEAVLAALAAASGEPFVRDMFLSDVSLLLFSSFLVPNLLLRGGFFGEVSDEMG
jgi:hypothetical protein